MESFHSTKGSLMWKMFFALKNNYFKNCQLKSYSGNQKWLFYDFTAKSSFWNSCFVVYVQWDIDAKN